MSGIINGNLYYQRIVQCVHITFLGITKVKAAGVDLTCRLSFSSSNAGSLTIGAPSFAFFDLIKGGLSLFSESATFRTGFTKPSRGLHESFAECLLGSLVKPARRFREPFEEIPCTE